MWTKASGSNFFGKDFVYTFIEKIGSQWEKMYVLEIVRKFETRQIAHLVLSECDMIYSGENTQVLNFQIKIISTEECQNM